MKTRQIKNNSIEIPDFDLFSGLNLRHTNKQCNFEKRINYIMKLARVINNSLKRKQQEKNNLHFGYNQTSQ